MTKFGLFEQADIEIGCPGKTWRVRDPDLAVVDECHHAPADSWAASLEDCNRARWGFTATPFRNDEKTPEIFNLIGNVIFQIDQGTLRGAGAIVPGFVKFIEITGRVYDQIEHLARLEFESQHRRFPNIPKKELLNRCRYRFAKAIGIEKNEDRNNRIAGLARDQAASTLLLVGSIEHGERILELSGVPCGVMLHSKTKGRKKIVQAFREKDVPLLVATSLADEGFDAPCASVLILAAGGRAANRVEQRAGRVLRPAPGKTHGVIYDFLDTQHPFLQAQSQARLKVYQSLGYQFL
jgi:superfamily II DNA or RNA helicase